VSANDALGYHESMTENDLWARCSLAVLSLDEDWWRCGFVEEHAVDVPSECRAGVFPSSNVLLVTGPVTESLEFAADQGIAAVLFDIQAGASESPEGIDVIVVNDHVNLSGSSPLIGRRDSAGRFHCLDLGVVYDARMREALLLGAEETSLMVREGVLATAAEWLAEADYAASLIAAAEGSITASWGAPESHLALARQVRIAAWVRHGPLTEKGVVDLHRILQGVEMVSA